MKTLMIGLDGATWKVMDRLIEQGRLKNIERLMSEGAAGLLKSRHPLISAVLWTSIATGKVPEKHGIKGFTSTSKQVRCKRIWDILQGYGWKVGLFGYFSTWPPPEVKGFVIPHIFATSNETHPKGLSYIQELIIGARAFKKFPIFRYLSYAFRLLWSGLLTFSSILAIAKFYLWRMFHFRAEPKETFWRKAVLGTKIQGDIFVGLVKKYRPDFAYFHIHLLDSLSHKYWKYMDPQGFDDVTDEDVRKFSQVIPKAYMESDREVGRIYRRIRALSQEDFHFVLLSDHGFASVIDVLEEDKGKRELYGVKAERLQKISGIENYAYMVNVGSRIYCYLRRDEPSRKEELIRLFSQTRLKKSNKPLFEIEELGDYILLRVKLEAGIPKDEQIEIAGKTIPLGSIFVKIGLTYSGTHHPDGIVILCGPSVRKGFSLQSASILDITPTILAMAGLKPAKDMDGKVLKDIFVEEFLRQHPLEYVETYEEDHQEFEGEEREMDEALREKLRGFGYI